MDFALSEDQELLCRSVREFCDVELRPFVREWDDAQALPPALYAKLGAIGLMGMQCPEAFGGSALSAVDYCLCIEELARVDPLGQPVGRST